MSQKEHLDWAKQRGFLSPEELQAIVAFNESVAIMQTLTEQRLDDERWVEIPTAVKYLGDISPRWIADRIRDGRFKHGREFVNTSDGEQPRYLVSVGAIKKYLRTPPEKRSVPSKKTDLRVVN